MDDVTHIRVLSFGGQPFLREGIAATISNESAVQLAADSFNRNEGIHKSRTRSGSARLSFKNTSDKKQATESDGGDDS
jgi:hypothetical protein